MDTEQLLQQIESGDEKALNRLLEDHRDYLRRILELRMDQGMRQRIDPSDVIQETQLVASCRIDDFLKRRPTTFKLWLRQKALEQLINLRRRHVTAAKRSVYREVRLSNASSMAVAAHLLQRNPSELVRQWELVNQVNQAVSELSEVDREVLLLRHGELLSNPEAAEVLEISNDAASKRYGRAILHLRTKLIETGLLSRE